jgi:hypothetical protein
MKIKTINVVVTQKYGNTEIHSYFIADNLPAETINQSVSEAYEKFRTCIGEAIKATGLLRDLTEKEMADVMEKEYWGSDIGLGVTVEIIRSEV